MSCFAGIYRQRTIAKQEGISRGMIYQWINKYRDGGPEALIPSKRTGNPFAALYNSKSMSEVDRLKLLVAKQEIEINRLKKGYIVKGVGVNKEFVITNDASSK
ncbi:MAG: helix-turn-helix domain-containing protein [Tyzzerella sp.]|nr:helix-turn-helix domain-containing protein [Tyzzerella sp.]